MSDKQSANEWVWLLNKLLFGEESLVVNKKLLVAYQDKESLEFYGILMFITVFTRARLRDTNSVNRIFLRYVLVLYSYLNLGLPSI